MPITITDEVLDVLEVVRKDYIRQHPEDGVTRASTYIKFYPNGDGAAIVWDNIAERVIEAVDFDEGADLLKVVRRLAEKIVVPQPD